MGGCPLMPEIVLCDDDARQMEKGTAMKIRADFVTSSSSSTYLTVRITLKN